MRTVNLTQSLMSGAVKRLLMAIGLASCSVAYAAEKPNILVIWGDDIGISNISAYSDGIMGYTTPNIDRIAKEGMRFLDYYGDQSCTAGRSTFITGQSGLRTGLTKVGMPGADLGLRDRDVTLAELLKDHGYATGQFGKNHMQMGLAQTAMFLQTFQAFPPSQRPDSWSVDRMTDAFQSKSVSH